MFTLIASHHIRCSLCQSGPSGLPQLLTGLPASAKVILYRPRADHVTPLLGRIPLYSFKANILKNTSTIPLPPQHPPVTPITTSASLPFLEHTGMSYFKVCHPAALSERAHSLSSFGFLLKGQLISEAVTGHPI